MRNSNRLKKVCALIVVLAFEFANCDGAMAYAFAATPPPTRAGCRNSAAWYPRQTSSLRREHGRPRKNDPAKFADPSG
jgi:hypothetical protein